MKRRFIAKVLIFAALLLPVLELSVRVLLPQQLVTNPAYLVPDYTGLGLRIDANVDMQVNTGERDVRLITDEQGYRIGSAPRSETPDVTILAVGDSFLTAVQVEYEQSTAGQLEQMLSDDLDQTVQVINSGVPGYGPDHYLLVVQHELERTSYDMVIVFLYAGNDFVKKRQSEFAPREKRSKEEFKLPTSLSPSAWKFGVFYPINERLERVSHLYILFKNKGNTLLTKLGLSAASFPDEIMRNTKYAAYWATTAEVMAEITAEADAHGVPVLFVLQPTAYQVDASQLEWAMDAYDVSWDAIDLDLPSELLGAAMADHGLTLIDPLAMLRDAHEQSDTPLFGHVDAHFAPRGHRLLAAYMLPEVLGALE